VLANKMDQDEAVKNLPRFIRETGVTPLQVSAINPGDEGVAQFKQRLWEILRTEPKGTWRATPTVEPSVPEGAPSAEEIICEEALQHAPFLDLARKPPKKRGKR